MLAADLAVDCGSQSGNSLGFLGCFYASRQVDVSKWLWK